MDERQQGARAGTSRAGSGHRGQRPAPADVRRVAVLGTGTVGSSWVAFFLSRGLEVTAWDPAPGAAARVQVAIERAWPALERLGLDAAADPRSLHLVDDPVDAVRDTEFVQENGPEDLDVKRDLYGAIDPALAPSTVVASSSSGLLVGDLQAGLAGAARFAVGHPFNPPHLVPLVEVVGGPETEGATIEWLLAFYTHLGKRPIHIRRAVPGHVANRLQAALWREAIHLVVSGVASVADVDTAIAHGPGLRWALMGPHLTFHLGGGAAGIGGFIDHLGPAFQRWWEDLGTPTLTPEVRRALVDGISDETSGRTIDELAATRDRQLLAVLEALARARSEPAQDPRGS